MRLVLLTVFCLLVPQLGAGEVEITQVLFEAKPVYPTQGGPGVKWASFSGQDAILVGGVGGVLVGERWTIGVASYSLASQLVVNQGIEKRDLGISYGGVSLGSSFFPRRLSYFNVAALIGVGQAWAITRKTGATRDVATFAVVEPEFSWVVNLTHEVRASFGVSWRAFAGADLNNSLGMDLGGPAASLTLLYGKL